MRHRSDLNFLILTMRRCASSFPPSTTKSWVIVYIHDFHRYNLQNDSLLLQLIAVAIVAFTPFFQRNLWRYPMFGCSILTLLLSQKIPHRLQRERFAIRSEPSNFSVAFSSRFPPSLPMAIFVSTSVYMKVAGAQGGMPIQRPEIRRKATEHVSP